MGSLERDDFANVSLIETSNKTSRKFGSHYCTDNCNENSLEAIYKYNYANPETHCLKDYTGVLCGRCQKGKSLTLVTQVRFLYTYIYYQCRSKTFFSFRNVLSVRVGKRSWL